MEQYKHIGWILYCTTATSLSNPKDPKVTPWPCNSIFGTFSKPELKYNEDPEQFFWKEMYGNNN